MQQNFVVGAQLSTSHSQAQALKIDDMLNAVERVRSASGLDLLVLGFREEPEIYRRFTAPARPVSEIFLWYNLLSDIDDMDDTDLVVNWRGERSRGWGGWADAGSEVEETFRFVCPNNPAPRRKTLARLRELLSRYRFSGVFLDKMRFPSPANGLDEALSCFCIHCRRTAKSIGLDLEAVADMFASRSINCDVSIPSTSRSKSGYWLSAIAANNPLLSRFLQFRADSVLGVVADAAQEARRLGRSVSLDLFSPCLAQLVGQDYRRLARHCAWAKPMTYRIAKGPAGLRLEIPKLFEDVSRSFGVSEESLSKWARHVAGFDGAALAQTRASAVPMTVMKAELLAAVRAMHPVPVYFGLELIHQPGIIDVEPAQVLEMVQAGRAANAAGLMISWDLMHAPMDGIQALAGAL